MLGSVDPAAAEGSQTEVAPDVKVISCPTHLDNSVKNTCDWGGQHNQPLSCAYRLAACEHVCGSHAYVCVHMGCACVMCGPRSDLNDFVQRGEAAVLEVFAFLQEVETEPHIEKAHMLDAVGLAQPKALANGAGFG